MPLIVVGFDLDRFSSCRPGARRRDQWPQEAGRRHVLLGAGLLDGFASSTSGEWVFSGDGGDKLLDRNHPWTFGKRTRDAAGIMADEQLHHLRYAHTSRAVMNAERLHVAGRPLEPRRASTTNRYAHLDDARVGQAADRVVVAIARKLHQAGKADPQVPRAA